MLTIKFSINEESLNIGFEVPFQHQKPPKTLSNSSYNENKPTISFDVRKKSENTTCAGESIFTLNNLEYLKEFLTQILSTTKCTKAKPKIKKRGNWKKKTANLKPKKTVGHFSST